MLDKSGTSQFFVGCRLHNNGDTSKKIDGTTTTCGTSSDDRIAFYMSTTGTGAGNAFLPPAVLGDTNYGGNLSTVLSVTSTSSEGTFIVNPAGYVCDDNAAGCDGSSGGTGTGGAGICHLEGIDTSFAH